jgi:dTDP-3-amino-3,4,6-trideoxy-alpha-D-glucose transaminase
LRRRATVDVKTKDYPKQYRQIWDEVRAAIDRVLLEDDPILGAEVERFEQELAAAHEVPHAVGVGSGTAALTLAMRALGVGPGDEVITCAHTFAGVVSAILDAGAIPVLVEPDPVSMLLDAEAAAAAVSPRTRAVLAVHLYGHPADVTALAALCATRSLLLIEDVAQAHGARWRGRPLGGFGSAAAMSFHPSKNLAAFGDGGAILCRSDETAGRLRMLRNLGKDGKHRFAAVASNDKLDTIQAAILRVRLRRLEEWIERRRSHARLYSDMLEGVGDLTLPREHPEARHAWHLFVVRTHRREPLREHLAARGIRTSLHYPIAAHLQPALAERLGTLRLPRTEELAQSVLTLPLSYEHEREEIERAASAVRAFFGKA